MKQKKTKGIQNPRISHPDNLNGRLVTHVGTIQYDFLCPSCDNTETNHSFTMAKNALEGLIQHECGCCDGVYQRKYKLIQKPNGEYDIHFIGRTTRTDKRRYDDNEDLALTNFFLNLGL